MRDMLNTLLDFFRLDNGKEQPKLLPCRISTITHTLETEFMPVAMNKGLSLTVKNGNDAVVLTDKERIIQIGNNLLSNAIKFTEKGGVSLTIDYTNGVLTLIFEDTGTGMTEDEQQRVFGAFERLSNAAAKDGFGLGLAIVHNIVAMLDGKIHLESEKGKGSRFTVEIPMQKAEEIPEKEIQTYIHREERNLNVVAIDNDEVLLLMLKRDVCTGGNTLRHLHRCGGTDGNDTPKRIQLVADGLEYARHKRLRAAGTAPIVQCWQFTDNPRGRGNRFGQLRCGGTFGTRLCRMPVQTILHIGTAGNFRQVRH